MEEGKTTNGKTTIAPDVLLNIASLTTLSTDGVSRLSSPPGGVSRLWTRGHQQEGVRIEIAETTVNVDLFVILKQDVNVRQVSRNIQQSVSRAISEMVGMTSGNINVHIEDIDFEEV
jgi:uncharacterized alkaline shock family protein YloU